MDRIPIEVLKIIFEFLSVSQLKGCMRVCKKWKLTVDALMDFDCLVVYQDALPINQRFFHTNQMVSLQHCIHVDNFFGESEFKQSIYRKFKRLYLYDHFETFRYARIERPNLRSCWHFSETSKLNWLNQLEELHLWMVALDEDCRLVLPSLKTFKTLSIFGHTLTLDAPQLTNLSVFDFQHLRLVHPQTTRTLQFTGLTLFTGDEFKCFLTMCGLKCLLLQNPQRFLNEQRLQIIAFLRNFGDLSEIHVEFSVLLDLSFDIFFCGLKFYEMVKQLRAEVGDRIRIYFAGLEMACLLDLPNYPHGPSTYLGITQRDQLDFYLANSQMTSETIPFYDLNYQLIDSVNDELNFFASRRLPQLNSVVVNAEVRDERALGRWLKSQHTVSELFFEGPLSQEFYSDILPASCPNVEILTFRFKRQIDFSFLINFEFLHRAVCRPFSHDLVKLLFRKLVYFKKLIFTSSLGSCLKILKKRALSK